MASTPGNAMVELNNYATRVGTRIEHNFEPFGGGFRCTMRVNKFTAIEEGKNKKEAKLRASVSILNEIKQGRGAEGTPAPAPASEVEVTSSPAPVVKVNVKGALQEMLQKRGHPVPEYKQIGRTGEAHCPTFTFSCTVKLGQEVLEVTGVASSKKEAEAIVAQKMYDKINSEDGQLPSVSTSPPQSNHKAPLNLYTQHMNYMPPEYTAQVSQEPDMKSVKCTIRNSNNDIIAETFGNGKSIKDAESDAARCMLEKLKSGKLKPQAQKSQSEQPQDDLKDDELVAFIVSKGFGDPRILWAENPQKSVPHLKMCLASSMCHKRVSYCSYDTSRPVVAQGLASSKEEAKRSALINLISNINELGLG